MQERILTKQTLIAVGLIVAFYPLTLLFRLDTLIILLNGVFFGCVAALVVAFGQIFWYAIQGVTPYDRVRQMTIGWFLNWVIIIGGVVNSFYIRSADLPTTPLISTAVFRYIAIISAVLQITAPDFGLGIFHGRDRKVLWISGLIGIAISMVAVYIQANQLLEPLVRSALDHLAFRTSSLS